MKTIIEGYVNDMLDIPNHKIYCIIKSTKYLFCIQTIFQYLRISNYTYDKSIVYKRQCKWDEMGRIFDFVEFKYILSIYNDVISNSNDINDRLSNFKDMYIYNNDVIIKDDYKDNNSVNNKDNNSVNNSVNIQDRLSVSNDVYINNIKDISISSSHIPKISQSFIDNLNNGVISFNILRPFYEGNFKYKITNKKLVENFCKIGISYDELQTMTYIRNYDVNYDNYPKKSSKIDVCICGYKSSHYIEIKDKLLISLCGHCIKPFIQNVSKNCELCNDIMKDIIYTLCKKCRQSHCFKCKNNITRKYTQCYDCKHKCIPGKCHVCNKSIDKKYKKCYTCFISS